jgi:tetratricopeptide (TPR) repeat protein
MIIAMKKIIILLQFLLFCNLFAQDPNDMSMLRLGQQYEKYGEIEKAHQIYEKLYNKNPNHYDFFNSYRNILEYSKKYEDANSVIQNWLNTWQNDYTQLTNYGINLFRLGNEHGGNLKIQEALKMNLNNIQVYRSVADLLLNARYYDKALEVYFQARKIDPNSCIIEISSIYIFQERYEEAINEYLKLININGAQFSYVQSIIVSHFNNKDFLDKAATVIEAALKNNANNTSYYQLLTWIYNEQKRYDDSFNLYTRIEKIKNSGGADMYSFSDMAFREKYFEVASKGFKYIIDNYKNSPYLQLARLGYAKSFEEISNLKYTEQLNKSDKKYVLPLSEVIPFYSGSVQMYEDILKDFPKSPHSAEILFRIGEIKYKKYADLDGAINSFKEIINNYSNNPFNINALLALSDVYFLQNKIQESAKYLDNVKVNSFAQQKQKDLANFKTAKLLYFDSKFDSTLSLLLELGKNFMSDYSNDAFLLMNFIQDNKKNKLLPIFAKAEMLESQKKLSEALALYNEIAFTNDENNSLADEAFLKMGLIQKQIFFFEEAQKSFSTIIDRFPESLLVDKVLFLLGELYQNDLKDKNKAILSHEKILIEFPNSMYLNEARKRLRSLKEESNL